MLNRRFLALVLFAAGVPMLPLRAAEPVRRALLVGINQYKNPAFQRLSGAAGDADWLKTILTSKFGFRDEDVVVLKDSEATRARIIREFRTHLMKSKPGDVALFYFAGHGAQVLTPPYTVPPATIVETAIVPYDARDPGVFDIRQSELHTLFKDLLHRTQNVTSILDSCFSAAAVKGDNPIRAVPADNRDRPAGSILRSEDSGKADEPQARGLEGKANPVAQMVRIAAAGANQFSNEYTEIDPNGQKISHGLMSNYLFQELASSDGKTTWRKVMDRTASRVNSNRFYQLPDFEAPNKDDLLFGGAGPKAREAYFLADPAGLGVALKAGTIHAVTAGTQLDVYDSSELEFTGPRLAVIEVTSAAATTSRAKILTGDVALLKPSSRAVVRFRPPSAFHFRVFFDATSPLLTNLRDAAVKIPDVLEEKTLQAADAVVRQSGKGIAIEHPDGSLMSDPAAPGDDALPRVLDRLKQWSDWFRNLNAEGGDPVMRLQVLDLQGAPLPRAIDSSTQFRLNLCNRGTTAYYARIFIFRSDGEIVEFKDTDGFDQYSKPIDPSPACVPASGKLKLAPPPGRTSGVEFIKVYATPQPATMDFLNQAASRGDTWSADKVALRVSTR